MFPWIGEASEREKQIKVGSRKDKNALTNSTNRTLERFMGKYSGFIV